MTLWDARARRTRTAPLTVLATSAIAKPPLLASTMAGPLAISTGNDTNMPTAAAAAPSSAAKTTTGPRLRPKAPRPDPAIPAAIGSIAHRAHIPQRDRVATVALVAASIGMVLALALSMAGIFGHSHLGTPEGRDSEALMISLAGGYALAAWRPARIAMGLFPVALLAALVTTSTSVIGVITGTADLAAEAAHLPLILGAIGTGLAARPTVSAAVARQEVESPGLVHA